MKYAWMEGQRTCYTQDEMCAVLAVSKRLSRMEAGRGTRDRQSLTDAQLLALIRAICE